MSNIPTIETERLRLRGYNMADYKQMVAFFATQRSQFVGGPQNSEEVWRWFSSDMGQWYLLGFGSLTFEDKVTGEFIGQVGLSFPDEYPECEIGWVMLEQFEGKGYAFEAATAARDYAFSNLGRETLVSYIDPDNARSIKLAERMGAIRDETALTPRGEKCLVYRHMPKLGSNSA